MLLSKASFYRKKLIVNSLDFESAVIKSLKVSC